MTIEELTRKNSALVEEKEELSNMISDLMSQNDEFVKKNDKLTSDIQSIKDSVNQLKTVLQRTKKNARVSEIVDAIKFQIQEYKVKIRTLLEENNNKDAQIQEMEDTINNQKDELDQAVQENDIYVKSMVCISRIQERYRLR